MFFNHFFNQEQYTYNEDPLENLYTLANNVTSDYLQEVIEDHRARRDQMIRLYERYKASIPGTPVLSRQFDQPNKVNNKLNNPFMTTIIDSKVGYFVGKPIAYELDNTTYTNDALFERHNILLKSFNQQSRMKKLDADIVKMASICGYGVRLLYIDQLGKERAVNINPWEWIFIEDSTTKETIMAIRHYEVDVHENNRSSRMALKVEVYDHQNIYHYLGTDYGTFIPDPYTDVNPRPHLFDGVPVIKFKNNEEEIGDVERVLHLIDAYDRSMSDLNSEIEQLRLAYMVFKGYEPDEDTMAQAKKVGAFGIDKDDSDIFFLTKDINSDAIEKHLDRLAQNIMRFADSVDLTDESFAGNLSGIAIKYKLFGLETKCGTLQMEMEAALARQYEILATAWNKKGVGMDPTNVFFTFTRNLPVNVTEEIENNIKLKDLISTKTRLGLLPVVDDVQYELDQMENERKAEQSKEESNLPLENS